MLGSYLILKRNYVNDIMGCHPYLLSLLLNMLRVYVFMMIRYIRCVLNINLFLSSHNNGLDSITQYLSGQLFPKITIQLLEKLKFHQWVLDWKYLTCCLFAKLAEIYFTSIIELTLNTILAYHFTLFSLPRYLSIGNNTVLTN